MGVSVLPVCMLTIFVTGRMETCMEHQIPWNKNYRQLLAAICILGFKLGSPGKEAESGFFFGVSNQISNYDMGMFY